MVNIIDFHQLLFNPANSAAPKQVLSAIIGLVNPFYNISA